MALNLTRKKDEAIYMDIPEGYSGRIKLVVRETGKTRISLAIDADKDVRIVRAELEKENVGQ